jgi:hypothetical protein
MWKMLSLVIGLAVKAAAEEAAHLDRRNAEYLVGLMTAMPANLMKCRAQGQRHFTPRLCQ